MNIKSLTSVFPTNNLQVRTRLHDFHFFFTAFEKDQIMLYNVKYTFKKLSIENALLKRKHCCHTTVHVLCIKLVFKAGI